MEVHEAKSALLPWEEIARILDLPVVTVRQRYEVAMAKLRTAVLEAGISEQEFAQYIKMRFDR